MNEYCDLSEESIIKTPEMAAVMEECFLHTKVAAGTFFPDRLFRDFTTIHDRFFELLDSDAQKICIAAPRGFGKTTLGTIIFPAKKIIFGETKFLMPVSATALSAVSQAENLKRELLSNIHLNRFFGPMKSDMFSKEQWVTASDVMVMPRGAGQQVRGQLYKKYRPDLIVVDDLETTEGVQTEEQRKKLKEWFYSDLCNCVDRSRKDWKIIVIGTVLHEDSLIVELLEDPSWESIRLEICDDDFNSYWPDFMSSADCKALYEEYKRKGQADVFYREYRNIPISTENATFKVEYFKYYEETQDDFNPKELMNCVIVDPAKTVQLHSADSAVVCWGIDRKNRRMYFRDCIAGKMHPDELYDAALGMVKRMNAQILAVEVTSLNEFITQPIKNEMRVRGIFPRFVELKARGQKEDRIKTLAPFYRLGYIYHNKSICTKLESQLIGFPRSKYLDVMDASAYIVELMELEGDYFDPMEINEDPEEDYKELDNDSPIEFTPYV